MAPVVAGAVDALLEGVEVDVCGVDDMPWCGRGPGGEGPVAGGGGYFAPLVDVLVVDGFDADAVDGRVEGVGGAAGSSR